MQIHESMLEATKEDVLKAFNAKHPEKLPNGDKNPLSGKSVNNADNIWKAIQEHKKKVKA